MSDKSDKAEYVGMLEVAIQIQHDCRSLHKDTAFVEEKAADGEIVWQGDVETFDLIGHRRGRKCYAWQHVDGRGHAKIVTVIATPFIDSPRRAVQVAIFAEAQPVGLHLSRELEVLRGHVQDFRELLRRTRVKTEDLAAAIYTAEGIMDFIREARNVPMENDLRRHAVKPSTRFMATLPTHH